MAGIHWRHLCGTWRSLHLGRNQRIQAVCADSGSGNRAVPDGAGIIGRHAVFWVGELLEVQETAVVAASPYKRKTDPELVKMCLEGDGRAWEALIKRYRRYVYSIPVKFGFTPAEAADIFQNVCLILLEHLQELKDETKISFWLGTTAARLCMAAAGERQRETSTPDEEFEKTLDPTLRLEEIRLVAESQQDLRDCIDELPQQCRDLLEMLYFEQNNPSYKEISNALGISVGAIAPTRNRCLDKLRRILKRRGIK